MRTFSVFVMIWVLAAPIWAADPRVEDGYTAMETEDWDGAVTLGHAALADAATDEDRVAAQKLLAIVGYYTDDLDGALEQLIAVDKDAVARLGRDHPFRIELLETIGLAQSELGDQPAGLRSLTDALRVANIAQIDLADVEYAQLSLGWLYLDGGDPKTAAVIAADLQLRAIDAYGEADPIALEAGLIRGFAHLDLGNPVEAFVHAIPTYLEYSAELERDFPDLARIVNDFETEMQEAAAKTEDAAATYAAWGAAGDAGLVARRVERADLTLLAQLQDAVVSGDRFKADQVARMAIDRVRADDPVPVVYYQVLMRMHLVAEDPAAALPWANRLIALPVGFLAIQPDLGREMIQLTTWLSEQGRTGEALALTGPLLRALKLRDGATGPFVQRVLIEESNALAIARQFSQAEAVAQSALRANEAHDTRFPYLKATIEQELGMLAAEQKDLPRAGQFFRAAMDTRQAAGAVDDLGWSDLLSNLANTLTDQEETDAAVDLFRRAIAIKEALHGKNATSTVSQRVGLAVALNNGGAADEALVVLDEALQGAAERGAEFEYLRSAILRARASILRELGREEEAEQAVAEAIGVAMAGMDEVAKPQQAAEVYFELGRVAWSEDRLSDAQRYFDRSIALTQPDDPVLSRFETWSGRVLMEQGALEPALAVFRTVTARQRVAGRRDLVGARDHLPYHIEAAVRLNARGDGPEGLMNEVFEVAQDVNALSAGDAVAKASARWTEKPEIAFKIRDLQALDKQAEDLRVAYRVDLSVGGDGADVNAALGTVFKKRIALEEDFAQTAPAFSALMQPKSVTALELADVLKPHEVLVMFATSDTDTEGGKSASLAIAVTRDEIFYGGIAKRSELARLAGDLRCAAALTDPQCGVGSSGTRGTFSLDEEDTPMAPFFDLELAHQAFQALLEPVREGFAGKTHLIVVPDQALTSVPFHLLVNSAPDSAAPLREADWLLRDMAITIAPTVASVRSLRDGAAQGSANPGRFLGVGDPLIGRQRDGAVPQDCDRVADGALYAAAISSSQTITRSGALANPASLLGLSALPETRCELAQTAALFSAESRLVLQEQATEAQIKALSQSGALAEFGVLSFATHGLIAGEVGAFDAGLVLTPPKNANAVDDGLLSTGEIAELQLDADLVILSACNTAAGSSKNAEGLSGLASAFLFAGARNLLVSHWPVYSDAAAEITTSMFREKARVAGMGTAQALQRTMLGMLDRARVGSRESHPAYWAPFLIVGN